MFYEDNHIKIYNKDCRDMTELPDESVQMVCCSPPYWGLRKYSGEQELIWGDNHCEHKWNSYDATLLHENRQGLGSFDVTPKIGIHGKKVGQASFCSLCGCWRGAYGLEPTPEMYIEHTIEILREIRRVLRKDGVVFLNLGDSYAGSWGSMSHDLKGKAKRAGFNERPPQSTITGMEPVNWEQNGKIKKKGMTRIGRVAGLKPKDLCLIPFRVAIAAQEDGWWVRSVIIWSKPNPMPESVTDRPTESHEYILLLTKNSKYYWDADAVREPHHYPPHSPGNRGGFESRVNGQRGEWGEFKEPDRVWAAEGGRNIRSVWEFSTQPFPAAHFAVFPEKLPEICIKAATPEVGCCSKCGAPWERIIKRQQVNKSWWAKQGRTVEDVKDIGKYGGKQQDGTDFKRKDYDIRLGPAVEVETIGWQQTCHCQQSDKVPSIVLDPFLGAGTTIWVAKKLNRRAVGYEISEEYCQLAVDRCRQQVLL